MDLARLLLLGVLIGHPCLGHRRILGLRGGQHVCSNVGQSVVEVLEQFRYYSCH
jgi:hypothetical protein